MERTHPVTAAIYFLSVILITAKLYLSDRYSGTQFPESPEKPCSRKSVFVLLSEYLVSVCPQSSLKNRTA